MEAQITNKNLKHEEIAAKAYQIWEAAGRPIGCEMDHWLQAETELSKPSAIKASYGQTKPLQKTAAPTNERSTETSKAQPNRPGTTVRETTRARPSAMAA